MTRKSEFVRSGLKNFNQNNFLNNLNQVDLDSIIASDNEPDLLWQRWKENLMHVIDKHAPLRSKRIKAKKIPLDYLLPSM